MVFLAADVPLDGHQRVHRALRPAHAAFALHLRARRSRSISSTRARSSGRSSTASRWSATRRPCSASTRPDTTKPQQLRFFCLGEPYEFWGLIEGTLPFRLPAGGRAPSSWLGTDRLGRDMFSRIVLRGAHLAHHRHHRHRALASCSALVLGGLAGYYGGWIDSVVQRITEIIKSFPHLPLWLALSAAAAGHLVAAAGLFRHHHHPGAARLAGPGARRALQAPVAARGGLRRRRPDDGRQASPHHRPPSAAGLHEPPHRLGDPVDPVDDPGRDGPVVPRAWACGRPSPRGACF